MQTITRKVSIIDLKVKIDESGKTQVKIFSAKPIRHLVSKKKIRYIDKKEGFDLDLTYISDRIIAMGYPSQGTESLYRNPLHKVQKFFKKNHQSKFMIYNLCSERTYDTNLFDGKVRWFPFEDHNVPVFSAMLPFMKSLDQYLNADPQHVAAIHCKAGKGRTGTIISTYLLHTGKCKTAEEALSIFGKIRTEDGKGVTIPSQRRWVHYYEHSLKHGFPIEDSIVKLKRVKIFTILHFDRDGGCNLYLILKKPGNQIIYDSRNEYETKHVKNGDYIQMDFDLNLQGDIKFQFCDAEIYKKDGPICHFWINTSFVDEKNPVLTFPKMEIDNAVKDKKHVKFDKNFKIEVTFEIIKMAKREKLDENWKVGNVGTLKLPNL